MRPSSLVKEFERKRRQNKHVKEEWYMYISMFAGDDEFRGLRIDRETCR